MPTHTLAAATKFERDVMLHRLTLGLKARKIKLKIATGQDKVKVNGRQSHFQHILAYLEHTGKLWELKQEKGRSHGVRNLAYKASVFKNLRRKWVRILRLPYPRASVSCRRKGMTLPRSGGALI